MKIYELGWWYTQELCGVVGFFTDLQALDRAYEQGDGYVQAYGYITEHIANEPDKSRAWTDEDYKANGIQQRKGPGMFVIKEITWRPDR